jgi:hypothetical protein
MVDETTFGTYVAPTRFLEFTQESLKLSLERIESAGLRPSRRVLTTDDWVVGRRGAGGDVEFEVANKGFGLMLKHMLGAVTSAQPNAGSNPTVWEHTGKVGALDAKSFTAQFGRAGNDGTVRAFSYLGCKVASWELSCDVNGILMLKATLDAADETTAQALATASYAATSVPLVYTGGTISVGGSQFDVTKCSVTGDNGLKADRYMLRGATSNVKKEQLEGSGLRQYGGTLSAEFSDLTAYNKFINGTVGAFTAFFSGANISGAYNYALEVTMPAVRFDGDTPVVGGPDIIEHDLPFKALDDGSGTTPCQMVYRTTDTTP